MTPRVNKLLTSGYNWALALTMQILNHHRQLVDWWEDFSRVKQEVKAKSAEVNLEKLYRQIYL